MSRRWSEIAESLINRGLASRGIRERCRLGIRWGTPDKDGAPYTVQVELVGEEEP